MAGAASSSERDRALDAVRWADEVVLALGINNAVEHEGADRSDTTLPAAQVAFALQVLALGKPVVLILINGGSLSIEPLLTGSSGTPAAIIEAFYPNSAGARSLRPY